MIDLTPARAFLTGRSRNEWIMVGTYNVYLRKGHHAIDHRVAKCLDLANIQNEAEVYGGFWELFAGLCKLGATYEYEYLYLENTHNERLLEAYRQRRCTIDGVHAYKRLT